MRINLLISLVLLTSMTGCASFRSADSMNVSETFQQEVAKDTVQELVRLYPPAHTEFQIRQLHHSCGSYFINLLRNQGYAVIESKGSWFQKNSLSKIPSTTLFYVVDRLSGSHLYRVSVAIGHYHLTRAYRLKKGQALGLGPWTMVG